MKDDLKERVDQFNALELPGQPKMMHMGTSYLVNDLWREVESLRKQFVTDVGKILGQVKENKAIIDDATSRLDRAGL